MHALISEFGMWTLIAVAFAAIVTSSIHGVVGVAGGFLMAAALAQLIGVRPVIPVLSVALLVSHSARSVLNFSHFNTRAFFAVMLPAIPMIAIGALFYGILPVPLIALGLGLIILLSIPVRHWARSRKIHAGSRSLNVVGGIYGLLAGASIGSGMLLMPFLLGYGLIKESFVATMAMIALMTNVTRIAVFGGSQLLETHYVILGLMIGALTIPGNWVGRTYLRRMATVTHSRLIDVFAIIGGLNFLYLAFFG